MTDDDPVRWKAGGETSPEFLRALHELAKPGPDVARVARVAEKLGTTLVDAPPPGSSSAWSKWLATKGWIASIVIGISAVSWLGFRLSGDGEQASKAQTLAVVEGSPPPRASIQPAEESHQPDVIQTPEPPSAAAIPPTWSARRSRRTPSSPARGQSVAQSPSTRPPLLSTAVGSEATVPPEARALSTEAESEKANPDPPLPPKPAPAREVSAVEPEAERSEVELLLDARKALRQQPETALRVLDQHAARFRSSQLGTERELLRIEVLRKLGRTEEATQRLHQFESRHPESFHLRRLQEVAGSR